MREIVRALYQEYRRRGEAAIRRAAVAELREIIGRALCAPRHPLLTYEPDRPPMIDRAITPIPPELPNPYVPPPRRALPRLATIEDI